jgi:hypothetical protein
MAQIFIVSIPVRYQSKAHLPVGAVDEGIRAIPKQPTFRNVSGVQFLSHHGLDGITPDGHH